MKRLVVATVPHSGTNLMKKILKGAGYRTMSPTDNVAGCDKVAHVAHVLKETQLEQIERLGRDWPVICPVRHPRRVAESWARADWPWTEDDLVQAYRDLIHRVIEPLGASVVPIDSLKRDYFLGRLEARIGERLRTDWGVVSPKSNTHALSMDELGRYEKTEALAQEMDQFLRRHYP